MHLIAKNVPGYGPLDRRCPLPCSGVSGRALTAFPGWSHGDFRMRPQLKIAAILHSPRGAPFACKAKSSDDGKNQDPPKTKHGASRSKKVNNEKSDSFAADGVESQGPEEHKVLETFQSIHSMLGGKGDINGEKKTKSPKQQGKVKESDAIESLLGILRKHATSKDSSAKITAKSAMNGAAINGTSKSSSSRPSSKFARKSPINNVNIDTLSNSEEEEPDMDSDLESELESETKALFSGADVFDDSPDEEGGNGEEEEKQQEDLTTLKLTELKELAKARGIKKFSRMKKSELIELLTNLSESTTQARKNR